MTPPTRQSFQFPAYTHIPGVTPHPTTDPRGHSFGVAHTECSPPEWSSLSECELFKIGCLLFNAGYYWEAHEAWESVWIAAERTGLVADFVKSLIKLAAAGVKVREGIPAGAQRHLARAQELLLLTRLRLLAPFPSEAQDFASENLEAAVNSEKTGHVEQLLTLVRRLSNTIPDRPDPDAGRPVVLMGQIEI